MTRWFTGPTFTNEPIVIDGPMPEVTATSRHVKASDGCSWPVDTDPDVIEQRARQHLAIAAYLREHPPVDEVQVKAFTAIIDAARTAGEPETLARRLVEAGATAPVLKEES